MKYAVLAALALTSCQTIKVNGVEIKPGDQAKWGILAALTVAVAYHLAQDDDDQPSKSGCKTYASVPADKGGETFCAIPLD